MRKGFTLEELRDTFLIVMVIATSLLLSYIITILAVVLP